MQAMDPFWPGLENVPGFSAASATWAGRLGTEHELVRKAFLQVQPGLARFFPCPECGCEHEVIPGASGWVGVRQCESGDCHDLALSEADLELWELSMTKLARALARAFQLSPRLDEPGVAGVVQAGNWSAEAVPVFLAVQAAQDRFRALLAELCGRLRRPFIVFAPTNSYLDAAAGDLLERNQSAFFSLQATVALTPSGTLMPRMPPGELFAAFRPAAPTGMSEDTARVAFELVKRLDVSEKLKPPTLLTVFRLYCIEQLSASRIARLAGCAKSTVLERLKLLERKTGVAPGQLRPLSLHLARVDEAMTDPRARHIHRRAAAFGEEEDPEG